MRVLVTSTGGAGHFGPLVPFVEALRGDVVVVVPPESEAWVAGLGVPFRIGEAPDAADIWARVARASADEAAELVNRDYFGERCTAALLPAVEAAIEEHRPELVLHEAAEYASVVAAERRGIAHAQVAISLAEVELRSLDRAAPALEPYGVVEAIRASPYLTRFPASFDPPRYADTRRYREPAPPAGDGEPAPPPGRPAPPAGDPDSPPLLYVTLGTATAKFPPAAAAYRAVLDAVGGLEARVLLTIGRDGDPAALGAVPPNVRVERWVPQADILPRAAAVIAHGGSGTTLGALAAGVPLVLVPLFADQPVNAAHVAAAGAGLRVEPDPAQLRVAIEAVLGDPGYRRAARRISAEMAGYAAPPAIAGRITSVSESLTPVSSPSSTRTSSSLR